MWFMVTIDVRAAGAIGAYERTVLPVLCPDRSEAMDKAARALIALGLDYQPPWDLTVDLAVREATEADRDLLGPRPRLDPDEMSAQLRLARFLDETMPYFERQVDLVLRGF